jgi:hypothetical protein
VLFYVLLVCKCVLYYCHRVATKLQLIKYIIYHIIYHIIYIISYHIISYHIMSYHIISYHIISYHMQQGPLQHTLNTCDYPCVNHLGYRKLSRNISCPFEKLFIIIIIIIIIIILTLLLHIYDTTSSYCIFLVENLPDDGRKRPKHVEGLPHVCIFFFFFFFFFFFLSITTCIRLWLAQPLSSTCLYSVPLSSNCMCSCSFYLPKRHLPNVFWVFQLVF